MANKNIYRKSKTLLPLVQANELKHLYGGDVTYKNKGFIWKGQLSPTPLSEQYNVRIVYSKGGRRYDINVYIDTPLEKAEGHNKLEHVYSTKDQKICLYYPKAKEWDDTMSISRTIIPWACEWLYFYETWLVTGKWLGGGVHSADAKGKDDVVLM